ncbi:MAG: hypothetical protein ACRENE_27500, partial [Polyangiaceae bacterium]
MADENEATGEAPAARADPDLDKAWKGKLWAAGGPMKWPARLLVIAWYAIIPSAAGIGAFVALRNYSSAPVTHDRPGERIVVECGTRCEAVTRPEPSHADQESSDPFSVSHRGFELGSIFSVHGLGEGQEAFIIDLGSDGRPADRASLFFDNQRRLTFRVIDSFRAV